MDGILIVDKPEGFTSHDVVARVRRILKTKKVGHTGTLDPFATGVLVLLIGKATRLAQFLDKDIKEYDALVKFGYATDTGDRTGKRIEKKAGYKPKHISPDDLIRVITGFMGEIKQVPPMFSAKKVGGMKLYELARKGESVEREAVPVTIFKLQLTQDRLPVEIEANTFYLRFQVKCSAGTYIRTLAEDIGRGLGPEAHLEELRRTAAGRFGIDEAVTLEQLEDMEDASAALLPPAAAVSHLPAVTFNPDRAAKTLSGLSSRYLEGDLEDGQAVQMLDDGGSLIAVGQFDLAEQAILPKVVLG